MQSHTDFLGGTSVSTKKTETCFGRWDHGLEPLHIQVSTNFFFWFSFLIAQVSVAKCKAFNFLTKQRDTHILTKLFRFYNKEINSHLKAF